MDSTDNTSSNDDNTTESPNDDNVDNVLQGPWAPFVDDIDPVELAETNLRRSRRLEVQLDPIGMLAERLNVVITTVLTNEQLEVVERRFQRIIEATLDRAERELQARAEAEAKAKLLLPPPQSMVVPDISGLDVRGAGRNEGIQAINDTWGE